MRGGWGKLYSILTKTIPQKLTEISFYFYLNRNTLVVLLSKHQCREWTSGLNKRETGTYLQELCKWKAWAQEMSVHPFHWKGNRKIGASVYRNCIIPLKAQTQGWDVLPTCAIWRNFLHATNIPLHTIPLPLSTLQFPFSSLKVWKDLGCLALSQALLPMLPELICAPWNAL